MQTFSHAIRSMISSDRPGFGARVRRLAGFPALALLSAALLAGGPKPGQTMPVVSIIAYPQGFDQDKITVPAGQVLFIVENHTRMRKMELWLDPDSGPHFRDVHIALEEQGWREYVQLPAGHYTLTEAEHPRWKCEITVTPAQ